MDNAARVPIAPDNSFFLNHQSGPTFCLLQVLTQHPINKVFIMSNKQVDFWDLSWARSSIRNRKQAQFCHFLLKDGDILEIIQRKE
jgi:hypothetical protein